ncbi:MAG: RagB/SusD family nutrient uptake outer membrane protein [Bacteroides sp.]|nr:RagB/SusD family nutrient uptake outer membrane protein [Bacteroides sp.]
MKLKNSNKLAAVALAAASMLGVSSCNYLDVVPPEQAGLADAMKDHDHAKGFLYSCYAQTFHRDILPRDYRSVINSSTDEYLITETWYANEGAPAYAVLRNTQTTTAPAGYDPAFWNTFYAGIGQTLLFDQKLTTEGDANEVCNSADERTEWLAESRFCRAFYHFSLLRLYGPIPLTKELASMDTDLDQYPGRSHFDACVDWIAGEFDAAAANLPLRRTESSEMGRADQVVCKALKARLLLYAASDLWNGKFPSAYSGWRNNNYETPGYGKELVSRQFNPEKWQRALVACREALDIAVKAGYCLFDPSWAVKTDCFDEGVAPENIWVPNMAQLTSRMTQSGIQFVNTNINGYDPETAEDRTPDNDFDEEEFKRAVWKLRYLNTTTQSEKNTEIIWAQSPTSYNGAYGRYEARIPRQAYRYTKNNTEFIPDSWGGVAPTLYSVEHFLNADGTVPSVQYAKAFDQLNNDDFYKTPSTPVTNADHPSLPSADRSEIANICLNREPRFYAWIGFHGGDYLTLLCNGTPCVLNMRESTKQGRKLSDRNYSASGFLSMKHVDPYFHWDDNGTKSEGKNSPEVFIRMAELYLNLAECQAECAKRGVAVPAGYVMKDGATLEEEAMANVNKLRDRAYVGRLTADHLNKTEIRTSDGTTKVWDLVEWVRNERFIELWDEGHRYYDVRRWVAGEEYFGYGKRRTLNALKENPSKDLFYTTMMANPQYTFHYREYLYPIYVDQVYRNPQMVQNPGF